MKKLIGFLAAGIPGFLVALPLNVLLVELLGTATWIAYALVLFVQVTINFFSLILFVFKRNTSVSLYQQYMVFMSGVSLFRLLDWLLYVGLVRVLSIHFVFIQLFNVILFSLAKFVFVRRTIEGKNQ